jgi:hypothetical protein
MMPITIPTHDTSEKKTDTVLCTANKKTVSWRFYDALDKAFGESDFQKIKISYVIEKGVSYEGGIKFLMEPDKGTPLTFKLSPAPVGVAQPVWFGSIIIDSKREEIPLYYNDSVKAPVHFDRRELQFDLGQSERSPLGALSPLRVLYRAVDTLRSNYMHELQNPQDAEEHSQLIRALPFLDAVTHLLEKAELERPEAQLRDGSSP